MNLNRFQERILYMMVVLGGLGFALLCGKFAGSGQFGRIGLIFFILGIAAVCLILKARIWLLIPIFWSLGGGIPLIELPFAVRDMTVLIVFACFLVLMGFKIVREKPQFDLIDLLLAANILYLCTVFIRNPVGSKAFNSEMVGGKPYFNVFIACLAYFVIRRVPAGDLKILARLPLYFLPAPAFVALGALITTYVPALGGALGLGLIYSDFAAAEQVTRSHDVLERKHGFTGLGVTGMQVLTSYYRPLTFLLPAYFGRIVLALLVITAALLSGFRTALLSIAFYVVFSTYFRRRSKDLLAFALIGIIGLTILVFGNGRFFELPLAAQRALSFLPGNWDQAVVSDAAASVEWRVEMWAMVWNEDRWIRNKALGDGFGFTRRELALMEAIATGGVGFLGGAEQEAFMINGLFHHGPLSTIRYVGIIGMILYYSLILLLAVRAVKLVRATYGTILFPAALFVAMPIVYYALVYPLGGGQFNVDAPENILYAALLKLVDRAAKTLPANAPHSGTDLPEDLSGKGALEPLPVGGLRVV